MRLSWHYLFISLLIIVSIAVSILMIVAASSRAMSSLESALFQVVILGTGLAGSFLFGRVFALEAARDLIRPYARAAFRRVYSLHDSLYWLADRIGMMYEEDPDTRLELIQTLVDEQCAVGWDAMEDLRDIIPEDVDDIERRYAESDYSG